MAKIKKAQLGLKKEIPGTRKPFTRAEKDSTIKSWQKIMQAGADSTFRKPKKAQAGIKKKATPVYRDEMGKPRTAKEQRQWEKDELNMIDYKGRPADSYPGGKGKKKLKSGGSLGMKSVKAGYDKNPGVTRADIIVAGKGQAKKGAKIVKKSSTKKMKGGGKCKYGCK